MMIEIDGSHGEGGGALLRNALALSAVLGEPARIFNIRAGRKEPGLKMQHLTAVRALEKICNARVSGAEKGSEEVSFEPGKTCCGEFRFDVGTAGAVTLVLQAVVPAALHAEGKVSLRLRGGTDVPFSPSTNYFQHVFCDALARMGAKIKIETLRHGFYPRGGGEARVEIEPCALKPISLVERGKLLRVDARSIASESLRGKKVAERQLNGFKSVLKPEREFIDYIQSDSPGTSFQCHAHYEKCKLGAGALGAMGKPAEKVGTEAGEMLVREMGSGAAVDSHLADQLLAYMALADGMSEILVNGLSLHARTNVWLIERFIKKRFEIEECEGGLAKVSISGIGIGGMNVASGNAP